MKNNYHIHNKWLKKILIGILVLMTVLIVSVLALITLVNPNQYKPLVINQIRATTGANMTIGNLRWKFFPQLGIKADDVSVQTNSGLNQIPLLHVNSGALFLQILPLFHGQAIIEKVVVNGIQINLVTKQGQNNWNFNPTTNNNSNFLLTLSKINLQNVNINYLNASTNQQIAINNLNIEASTYNDGKILYFSNNNLINIHKVNFKINSILDGNLDLSYDGNTYTGAIDTKKFSLPELLASCNLNGSSVAAAPWKNLRIVSANFSGNSNSLQLTNSQLELGSSTITTTAQISSFSPLVIANDTYIDHLEASEFVPLKGYHLKLSDLHSRGGIAGTSMSSLVANQDLQISNLTLYGYDLNHLSAQIGTILSNPLKIITIPVTVNQIQASVKAAAGSDRKNLNLVSNLGSLSGHLNYRAPQLQFSPLYLNGPALRASGNAIVNTKNQLVNAAINAQFVAAPNSLTGKIVYPVTITANRATINWTSVSSQLTKNIGNSLIDSGKDVGNATVNTTKKIGSTIKSWF